MRIQILLIVVIVSAVSRAKEPEEDNKEYVRISPDYGSSTLLQKKQDSFGYHNLNYRENLGFRPEYSSQKGQQQDKGNFNPQQGHNQAVVYVTQRPLQQHHREVTHERPEHKKIPQIEEQPQHGNFHDTSAYAGQQNQHIRYVEQLEQHNQHQQAQQLTVPFQGFKGEGSHQAFQQPQSQQLTVPYEGRKEEFRYQVAPQKQPQQLTAPYEGTREELRYQSAPQRQPQQLTIPYEGTREELRYEGAPQKEQYVNYIEQPQIFKQISHPGPVLFTPIQSSNQNQQQGQNVHGIITGYNEGTNMKLNRPQEEYGAYKNKQIIELLPSAPQGSNAYELQKNKAHRQLAQYNAQGNVYGNNVRPISPSGQNVQGQENYKDFQNKYINYVVQSAQKLLQGSKHITPFAQQSIQNNVAVAGNNFQEQRQPKQVNYLAQSAKLAYPQPFPIETENRAPFQAQYQGKAPVQRPYNANLQYVYGGNVEKPVPFTIEKPVPYPVNVPVSVPYKVEVPVKVPHPVPYPVDKPVSVPVRVVVVEKPVPVFLREQKHPGFNNNRGNQNYIQSVLNQQRGPNGPPSHPLRNSHGGFNGRY